jgi:two-component system NtrC family sensor kinase
MPGMNGFDLAERIEERWPNIRILFISGCANDLSVKRQLYDRPMMAKPFTGAELNRRVRELLTPTPSAG